MSLPKTSQSSRAKHIFQCWMCKKKFASYQILKSHKLGHNHKWYKCDTCSHDYASNFSLSQHVNVKHKVLEYSCSFTSCDKTFNTKQSFYSHEKMNKYNYLFSCQKCGKDFMKEDHFKVHVNRHNQIRPFQHEYCGKIFYRKNKVKRHLVNTCQHTSESEIACPICFKILNTLFALHAYPDYTAVYPMGRQYIACVPGITENSTVVPSIGGKCVECDSHFL